MKPDKNLLSGSTTLLILALLSGGDMYGYEMIAQLEARLSRLEARLQGEYPPDRPQEDERFQYQGISDKTKAPQA